MKITKEFILETTTKALISFIPFVGGAVGSVLADVLAERKQLRLNDFLSEMKEDLDVHKANIKKDIIEDDDFLDIFELTSKKVMEERNVVKRLAYKNILINGLTKENSNLDDMEQCVRLVENATEKNIFLLKILSDPHKQNISLGEPIQQPNGNMTTTTLSRVLQKLMPNWQGGEILENLKDLEFLGLIHPISSGFQDMLTANGLSPVVNSLTVKGERFVGYLQS